MIIVTSIPEHNGRIHVLYRIIRYCSTDVESRRFEMPVRFCFRAFFTLVFQVGHGSFRCIRRTRTYHNTSRAGTDKYSKSKNFVWIRNKKIVDTSTGV